MSTTLSNRKEAFVSIVCLTDVGRVRRGNEDAFIVTDLTEAESTGTPGELIERSVGAHGLLLAVADGMGGVQAGEVAGQMAVEQLARFLVASPKTRPISVWLNEGLKAANREIRRAGQINPEVQGMGATITAAMIHDEQAIIGQVGDSRGYLIRGGQIQQVTKDQSLVQALLDAGQLTEEMASHSRFRNVILHALGVEDVIEPGLSFFSIERGDYLLLCSDGLSNKVGNIEIRDIVGESASLGEAGERLIRLANERGGEDNITTIIARFDGAGWPLPESATNQEIKVGYL